MSRWSWIMRRVVRRIWFRAAVISLFGVALALLAAAAGPYVPFELPIEIGQDAVGTILQIMASSMLAVTTFSLTAMVGAYGSATQLATPRATQLMISDPTSQNALSTFLGAFVFSIVGIIGLQTSFYGQNGRLVLFVGTILVVAIVVATLLRWIGHVAAFGRMSDVIDRVEDAAADAMRAFVAAPCLGGMPDVPVPDHATPVCADRTGYVTHVDVAALGRIAERCDLVVYVAALPGTLIQPRRPLMHVRGKPDEATVEALVGTFSIERHRSFDYDPRLGLIALSEIASRALSPAVNDPGTAVEIVNAILRVLLQLGGSDVSSAPSPANPRLHVPRPTLDDMLTDAFRPLIRDGAGQIEVVIRVHKALCAIRANIPAAHVSIGRLLDRLDEAARTALAGSADLRDYEDVRLGNS